MPWEWPNRGEIPVRYSYLAWARSAPDLLSPEALAVLGSADSALYLSIASLWECVIKSSIGKLDVPDDFYRIVSSDYEILGIDVSHLEHVRACPCTTGTPSTACWWHKPGSVV